MKNFNKYAHATVTIHALHIKQLYTALIQQHVISAAEM